MKSPCLVCRRPWVQSQVKQGRRKNGMKEERKSKREGRTEGEKEELISVV